MFTFPLMMVTIARMVLSFLLNALQFKRFEFGALILKPLRINGKRFITVCKGAIVKDYTWLVAHKIDGHDPELIINEGCSIGEFNHIAAVRKVEFGRHVLTAQRVYISDNLHEYKDINIPIMHQKVRYKSEVYIGDGSWIGENVCIIGVKIGKNCVIGANSVVTSDIPDYSVAVGAPARVVKKYDHGSASWRRVD